MKRRILILFFVLLFLLPACAAGNAEGNPEESASDLTPVAVEPGETPVDALARFTGDREHFRKTLEMLAKSVSASAAADALDG